MVMDYLIAHYLLTQSIHQEQEILKLEQLNFAS